eukprot:gene2040-1547_t
MSRPLIVTLGDSLTERGHLKNGWCQRLIEKYGVKVDILNRGYSGYNTEMLLPLVDEILEPFSKANLVTVLMGSNDSAEGAQNVSVDKFYSNLTKIIQVVKKQCPKAHIILISPPPVDEEREKYRKVDTLQKYMEMVKKISEEEKVFFLNFWETVQMQFKWEDFLEDGLHLEDSGNEFLYLEMKTFLDINIPELHPDNLEYPFKHWKEVLNIE